MADLRYVPEQLATQREGTCARDFNYLISAVVTKPGPTAKERCYRYIAQIISLSAANGSRSSMPQILDSMSQSTVVSYPQVIQQLIELEAEPRRCSPDSL
jgi:hypothetical protein